VLRLDSGVSAKSEIPNAPETASNLGNRRINRWLVACIASINAVSDAQEFRLVEVNLLEPQTLQQTADSRGRIPLGRLQDSIGRGCLLQLALRLLAHLRFQIRVGGHQQPSLPGIHSGFRAVASERQPEACAAAQFWRRGQGNWVRAGWNEQGTSRQRQSRRGEDG
jgi:hypothetical protein